MVGLLGQQKVGKNPTMQFQGDDDKNDAQKQSKQGIQSQSKQDGRANKEPGGQPSGMGDKQSTSIENSVCKSADD